MAKLLMVKTDAAETAVTVRPFEEDFEDTTEHTNILMKQFYQSLLDVLAHLYSRIEKPLLVHTESSWTAASPWSYQEVLTDNALNDIAIKAERIFRAKNRIPWLESAFEEIEELAALPFNWDGYGSSPPGMKECQYAKRLLTSISFAKFPRPNIVPVSGGGIQLEWQYQGRELELEIVAGSGNMAFLKVYQDGTTEEDLYPIAAIEITKKLLRWLFIG